MSDKILKIVPEFTAQRMSHPPNPSLPSVISTLSTLGVMFPLKTVADVGCGKLRHFKQLYAISKILYLVETEEQLRKVHVDGNRKYTIGQIAKSKSNHKRKVIPLSFCSFSSMSLSIDTIFCIAVFDVVLRNIRKSIITSAVSNLRKGGYFVLVIPRNDSSITDRCHSKNSYQDGHVFYHHGLYTFFKNFDSFHTVIKDCQQEGLRLIEDISNYRQVCLIFSNQQRHLTSGSS